MGRVTTIPFTRACWHQLLSSERQRFGFAAVLHVTGNQRRGWENPNVGDGALGAGKRPLMPIIGRASQKLLRAKYLPRLPALVGNSSQRRVIVESPPIGVAASS